MDLTHPSIEIRAAAALDVVHRARIARIAGPPEPTIGMSGASPVVMRRIADEVATRAGLDESEAAEAISTVNEAIAPSSQVHAEELIFRLASRLGIAYGRAIEVAQVACHSVAASLDEDERRTLLNRLPGDVRELFRAPASLAEPRAREPGMPGSGHTLADGRPGSEHSLAGSRPGSSHPLSQSQPPARHPR